MHGLGSRRQHITRLPFAACCCLLLFTLQEDLIDELTRSEREWGVARKQYQARMEQLQSELEETQRQLDTVKAFARASHMSGCMRVSGCEWGGWAWRFVCVRVACVLHACVRVLFVPGRCDCKSLRSWKNKLGANLRVSVGSVGSVGGRERRRNILA